MNFGNVGFESLRAFEFWELKDTLVAQYRLSSHKHPGPLRVIAIAMIKTDGDFVDIIEEPWRIVRETLEKEACHIEFGCKLRGLI
jgi:hypothetical protein